MSLQSMLGNAATGLENTIRTTLTSAKASLQNLIGSTKTSFTSLWDGGFAGISESGIASLKTELTNYCKAIEEQIATFDEKGNIENAFKGNIQVAAQEYIAAIKELLEAYVSTMKVNISEMDAAFEAYQKGAQDLSTAIGSDSDSIRAEASKVRID